MPWGESLPPRGVRWGWRRKHPARKNGGTPCRQAPPSRLTSGLSAYHRLRVSSASLMLTPQSLLRPWAVLP